MTSQTQQSESKTEQAPEAKKDQAPAAPDVEKMVQAAVVQATESITKKANEEASKSASKVLKDVGKILTGEGPVDQDKQALETLLTHPLKSMYQIKEMAKEEIREETRAQRETEKRQLAIVAPFVKEYPQLNSEAKLALVESLTYKHQAAGLSYEDALKKGCEETVKEFGLKSVSELEREGNAGLGLPSGGSPHSNTQAFNEQKSASSFVDSMKGRLTSFRSKSKPAN